MYAQFTHATFISNDMQHVRRIKEKMQG